MISTGSSSPCPWLAPGEGRRYGSGAVGHSRTRGRYTRSSPAGSRPARSSGTTGAAARGTASVGYARTGAKPPGETGLDACGDALVENAPTEEGDAVLERHPRPALPWADVLHADPARAGDGPHRMADDCRRLVAAVVAVFAGIRLAATEAEATRWPPAGLRRGRGPVGWARAAAGADGPRRGFGPRVAGLGVPRGGRPAPSARGPAVRRGAVPRRTRIQGRTGGERVGPRRRGGPPINS